MWFWIIIGLAGWCVVAVVLSLVIGAVARRNGGGSVHSEWSVAPVESPGPVVAPPSAAVTIPVQRSAVADGAVPAPTEQTPAAG